MTHALIPINKKLALIASAVSAFSLLTITLLIAIQVGSRYLLGNSITWTEPLARLLLSYTVFFAAAVGVYHNNHMGFGFFLEKLSPDIQHHLRRVQGLLAALFGLAMSWYGIAMCIQSWPYSLPALPLPMGSQYLPLTGGGLLILLFGLEKSLQGSPRWKQ